MTSHTSSQHTKSLTSQQDTRNPTTNKKVIYYTPVQKHSHPKYHIPNQRKSLNRSLKEKPQVSNQKLNKKCKQLRHSMQFFQVIKRYQLNERKNSCLRSSRYNEAKQINESITVLQRKRAKTQVKRLVSEHKLQHKKILKAHKKQMAKFEEVWQNYFIGLKAKEQFTLIQFRQSQQNDIRFVQSQLVEKCKSLKPSTGELKSLQKKQKQLQKQQRFDQLLELKKQKKHLKQKLLQQQHERIYNWAKKQEDFLKTYHTKKYNALMNRIEELHNDKYRQYQRESQRLRLKYNNVVKKLSHQQKLQMNQLLEKYSFVKGEFKGRSLTVNV